MKYENIDWHAARAAQAIIRDTSEKKTGDVENLITKALGVLQENGVYAAMLYLCSRSRDAEKQVATVVRSRLLQLLEPMGVKLTSGVEKDTGKTLNFLVDHVCKDLDILLMVKQIWEQTLIYARYGAKGRG